MPIGPIGAAGTMVKKLPWVNTPLPVNIEDRESEPSYNPTLVVALGLAAIRQSGGFFDKTTATHYKTLYLVEEFLANGTHVYPHSSDAATAIEAVEWFKYDCIERSLKGWDQPRKQNDSQQFIPEKSKWRNVALASIQREKATHNDLAPLVALASAYLNNEKMKPIYELAKQDHQKLEVGMPVKTLCTYLDQIYTIRKGNRVFMHTDYGVISVDTARPIFAPREDQRMLNIWISHPFELTREIPRCGFKFV